VKYAQNWKFHKIIAYLAEIIAAMSMKSAASSKETATPIKTAWLVINLIPTLLINYTLLGLTCQSDTCAIIAAVLPNFTYDVGGHILSYTDDCCLPENVQMTFDLLLHFAE